MNLVQVLVDTYTGCSGIESGIPIKLINTVSAIITIMKFGIPLLLIIFGMLDLGKAVIASKEDEIKKGQQMFIKRTITAVIVFFVVVVVQLVVGVAAENESEKQSLTKCINAFVKGVDEQGRIKGTD